MPNTEKNLEQIGPGEENQRQKKILKLTRREHLKRARSHALFRFVSTGAIRGRGTSYFHLADKVTQGDLAHRIYKGLAVDNGLGLWGAGTRSGTMR